MANARGLHFTEAVNARLIITIIISATNLRNVTSTLCLLSGRAPVGGSCPSNSGIKWLGMFMVSMIISGIGFSPVIPLSIVFFHDNVDRGKAAICISESLSNITFSGKVIKCIKLHGNISPRKSQLT